MVHCTVETFKKLENNYKKLFIPSFMKFIPAKSIHHIMKIVDKIYYFHDYIWYAWVFWYQLTEEHVQVCFEEFEEN